MEESRIRKSMKNTVFSVVGMLAMLLVSFISKSVFIKELGNAFNGVNYLIIGILNALNLAELGFAGAIAFALYKPLSNGDEELAAALMNLFKKVYRIVAVIVGVVGLLCIPFLQYLIKEDINTLPFTLNELRIYFSIYLLDTVCSYLLAYKRTIIDADQRSYITAGIDYSLNIALNIVQIVLLILTKSYYSFLFVMLAKTIIGNIVIGVIANKKYPYLVKYKRSKLLPDDKKTVFANVRAMLMHKIGTVVIVNSSTIIVSALVGVVDNGLYGNYLMISTQVISFVNVVYNAIKASIGNLCAEADNEKQIEVFDNINYLSYAIGYFVFINFICLFNPFITLWLGDGMTFPMGIVLMISINQCVTFLRINVLTFRDAKGLFRMDRYKPIAEAIVGIGLAIGLGYIWGIFGILLGYTISIVAIAIPIEKWALFKRGFNIKYGIYYVKDILMIAFTAIVTVALYFLTTLIPYTIGGFVLRVLISVVLSTAIFIACTFWTKEFKYFWSMLKNIVLGIKNKFSKKSYIIDIDGEIISTNQVPSVDSSAVERDTNNVNNIDNVENEVNGTKDIIGNGHEYESNDIKDSTESDRDANNQK